jgi:hypothetical protein
MPDAKVVSLCDELVAKVDAAWTDRGDADGVSREYVAPVNLDKPADLAGRRVYVFPVSFRDGAADRGEDFRTYAVEVWVAERYPDALAVYSAEARDWFDERVAFVEQVVYDTLDFGRRTKTGLLRFGGRQVMTDEAEVKVYEWEWASRNSLFLSSLELTLRELV